MRLKAAVQGLVVHIVVIYLVFNDNYETVKFLFVLISRFQFMMHVTQINF